MVGEISTDIGFVKHPTDQVLQSVDSIDSYWFLMIPVLTQLWGDNGLHVELLLLFNRVWRNM